MMGHHSRSESLSYYFRLEDQVSENHLLRLIEKNAPQTGHHKRAALYPNRQAKWH